MKNRQIGTSKDPVGIIGLGIMGGAYAEHLLAAGTPVFGFDLSAQRMSDFRSIGGVGLDSPSSVARKTDIILFSLPSVTALESVIAGPNGLAASVTSGAVVVEMSTFPIGAKEEARNAIAARGGIMLDCPVSGTGAQASRRDLDIYASGDADAFRRVEPVLRSISRAVHHVGPFGCGMKYKLIANLLVTIHNVAVAEALLLAQRGGLDVANVIEVLRTGAGSSRMLEVRGPMMARTEFEPATMRIETYMKDIEAIFEFANDSGAPTPLMDAAAPIYRRAIATGLGQQDTAAVYTILKGMR